MLLVELVRVVVLWSLWLERNKRVFQGGSGKTVKAIGAQIIVIATFWCKNLNNNSYFKLSLMLPCDTKELVETGTEVDLLEVDGLMCGVGSIDASEEDMAVLDF